MKENRADFVILFLYVFLTPWCFISGIVSDEYLTFIDIALPFLVIYVLAVNRRRFNIIPIMMLIFIALTIISSADGDDFTVIKLVKIYRLLGIFAPLLLLSTTTRMSDRDFDRIIRYAWVGCFITVVAGIALNVFGVQLRNNQQILWAPGGGSTLRAAGLTGNTGEYGLICAIWILLTLFYGGRVSRKFQKVLTVISLTVYFWALLTSSSRASALNVAVSVGAYSILRLIQAPKEAASIAIRLCAAVGLYFVLLTQLSGIDTQLDSSLRRIDFLGLIFDNAPKGDARLDTWNFIFSEKLYQSYLGIGYKNMVYIYGVAVDNMYISILIEQGVFSFCAIVIIMAVMIYSMVRSRSVLGSDQASRILAIFSGFFAHAATLDAHTMWSATPVLMAIYVAYIKYSLYQEWAGEINGDMKRSDATSSKLVDARF